MIILHDASEKILNYQLKAKDEAMDSVLANISHDLKTPINCMQSQLELAVKDKDMKEDTRLKIKISINQCLFLSSMVNDI